MTSIRASVHASDGTFIAHLPRRLDPQFLTELNGDGHGSFQIHMDDALLVSQPTLLAGGNVVKMLVTNAPDMDPVGWVIEDVNPTRTDSGGRAARVWTVSGRGMRAPLLSGGVVYPEYGLRAVGGDNRAFDFSSRDGAWRDTSAWSGPATVRWDLEATHRQGEPSDWPDTNAYWIWSSDPEATAPVGRNWFRTEFTLGTGYSVGIWAAADNVASVRLDGEEIMLTEKADATGPRKMMSWTGTLGSGLHTLAAWCQNVEGNTVLNPGAFICVAATLDSDGIPATLLTRTNASDWICHGYAPPTPGWALGQILKKLLDESVARNEMGDAPVTLDFTSTEDSGGNAWTDVQELALPVGTGLLDALAQLTDLGLDVEVGHDFTVHAWNVRGLDRSGSMTLRPGRDVEQNAPSIRYGTLFNSALMRHGTGWKLVEDATSIGVHGRRRTFISTGDSDSDTQAQQTAEKFFTEQATPQVSLPFTISSNTRGPKPFLDFGLGDVLSVPGVDGQFGPARCMSISVTQPEAGRVQYEVEFNPNLGSRRPPSARDPRMAFWRSLPSMNRSTPGMLMSRSAAAVRPRTPPRATTRLERFVFSRAGAADTTESVAWPIPNATPLRSILITAKTPGSSDSVCTVYVSGTSIGTVTLPAGDTTAQEFLTGVHANANTQIWVAMTTVGTGLADVTVIVDNRVI